MPGDYSGAGVDPAAISLWRWAEYATSFSILGPIWGAAIADVRPWVSIWGPAAVYTVCLSFFVATSIAVGALRTDSQPRAA